VRPEIVERRELEREGVRRREDDGRGDPGLQRLLPATGAEAPPVARDETAEMTAESGEEGGDGDEEPDTDE